MRSGLARVSLLSAILQVSPPIAYVPAQYQSGALPEDPIMAVSGGEVRLEADIDPNGNVVRTTALRMTPPFTDALRDAVLAWRFAPALELSQSAPGSSVNATREVSSKVLIVAAFRAPTLNTPTLGEPPRDVAPPSDDIPFPIMTVMPQFPPRALFGGMVLVEVRVGPDGRIEDSKVIQHAAAFDQPALDAAKQWTFRPARVHGRPTPSFVYIVFGFRQPVI